MRVGRMLTAAILALASLIGLVALLYPFVSPPAAPTAMGPGAHSQDAPLITIVLVVNSLLNSLNDIYNTTFSFPKEKPLAGFVQVVKIFVYF